LIPDPDNFLFIENDANKCKNDAEECGNDAKEFNNDAEEDYENDGENVDLRGHGILGRKGINIDLVSL
jgi:hypothetical protein